MQRMQFIRHCRSLDVPLSDVRQLLAFAAAPEQSCAAVDRLLDAHVAQVRDKREALTRLEAQLVALCRRCDGEASQPCAILESFMTAAEKHACACHPPRQ